MMHFAPSQNTQKGKKILPQEHSAGNQIRRRTRRTEAGALVKKDGRGSNSPAKKEQQRAQWQQAAGSREWNNKSFEWFDYTYEEREINFISKKAPIVEWADIMLLTQDSTVRSPVKTILFFDKHFLF